MSSVAIIAPSASHLLDCETNLMAPSARWRGQPLEAVLFDLDGTLLDTVGDISLALNRTLAEYGWAPVASYDVRRMIGRGSPILIERTAAAQRRELDAATQTAMVERFFHHYGQLQESGEFDAKPYPGVAECLRRLHGVGLCTAVVTNKQHRFASGLLERLNLSRSIDLIVGGDSCQRRKPDPEPLLFACEFFQVPPSRALMVGDSINDVEAARGASIPIICVSYGYNEGQDPRELPCDALIDALAELPAMLLLEPLPGAE
jgi:phosphoglycolate phosphatase